MTRHFWCFFWCSSCDAKQFHPSWKYFGFYFALPNWFSPFSVFLSPKGLSLPFLGTSHQTSSLLSLTSCMSLLELHLYVSLMALTLSSQFSSQCYHLLTFQLRSDEVASIFISWLLYPVVYPGCCKGADTNALLAAWLLVKRLKWDKEKLKKLSLDLFSAFRTFQIFWYLELTCKEI